MAIYKEGRKAGLFGDVSRRQMYLTERSIWEVVQRLNRIVGGDDFVGALDDELLARNLDAVQDAAVRYLLFNRIEDLDAIPQEVIDAASYRQNSNMSLRGIMEKKRATQPA